MELSLPVILWNNLTKKFEPWELAMNQIEIYETEKLNLTSYEEGVMDTIVQTICNMLGEMNVKDADEALDRVKQWSNAMSEKREVESLHG